MSKWGFCFWKSLQLTTFYGSQLKAMLWDNSQDSVQPSSTESPLKQSEPETEQNADKYAQHTEIWVDLETWTLYRIIQKPAQSNYKNALMAIQQNDKNKIFYQWRQHCKPSRLQKQTQTWLNPQLPEFLLQFWKKPYKICPLPYGPVQTWKN